MRGTPLLAARTDRHCGAIYGGRYIADENRDPQALARPHVTFVTLRPPRTLRIISARCADARRCGIIIDALRLVLHPTRVRCRRFCRHTNEQRRAFEPLAFAWSLGMHRLRTGYDTCDNLRTLRLVSTHWRQVRVGCWESQAGMVCRRGHAGNPYARSTGRCCTPPRECRKA